jgi:MFS family permease
MFPGQTEGATTHLTRLRTGFPVSTTPTSKTRLATLYFLHGAALSMWFVPLTTVLDAHGFGGVKPLAFACSAVAAFVSPLIFGALADRQVAPARVLRGLAVATGLTMALASAAIHLRAPAALVLALIQLHALCSAPTFSLSSTIILAGLQDSRREFGPLRALATLGWMTGCWVVSALKADASTLSGLAGAVTWMVLAGFTYALPAIELPPPAGRLNWTQRLGLDALGLLRHHDHRVVYLMVALFAVPIAAFYPYSPPHLRDLGLTRTSAWMTLGQVTEVLAMLVLGHLFAHWRLKWIFTAGLVFGVARFALCALNDRFWILAGVTLHGASFTLVVITAQIYLDTRVDPAWRARAQALLTLLTSGAGYLVGYLGNGWWFAFNTRAGATDWSAFWTGLAAAMSLVLAYFVSAYRGVGSGFLRTRSREAGPELGVVGNSATTPANGESGEPARSAPPAPQR